MEVGIVSIQRNRNPWIVEWLAFHLNMGFTRFYLYCHKTDDGMTETLLKLSQKYPIVVHEINTDYLPQLSAYQHAMNNHLNDVDWMAFIDGDEFLFPTNGRRLDEALKRFSIENLSAIAVYWKCYGGNGHIKEPDGLLVENYRRHSGDDFMPNRHVKTILRGRQKAVASSSHIFQVDGDTLDDRMRCVTKGCSIETPPSYDYFRINHYAVQSFEFFKQKKQNIGAPDSDPNLVRPDSWYFDYDRNECDDGVSYGFLTKLKLKVAELYLSL